MVCAKDFSTTEAPVAGIAEARDDIAARVEAVIKCGGDDAHTGYGTAQCLNTLRRGENMDKGQFARTAFAQEFCCGDGTAAGGEHGIKHEYVTAA